MTELLYAQTAPVYRRKVTEVVEVVADRLARTRRPFSGTSVATLRRHVDAVGLDDGGIGTTAALQEVDRIFLQDAVYFHDPGYMAHLNCPVAIPAVAAEAIIAAVNPSMDTFDQSTSGTLMERRLIAWTADRIGFAGGDGVFTSGGSQSNLQALLLARDRARRTVETRESRSVGLDRLVVFATDESHFSVRKSCRILGLPDSAVVPVAVDATGAMSPRDLAARLDALAPDQVPMSVCTTAGTTDRGAIDPLVQVAEVCERHQVWMHVDAAYGCGLLVSPRPERRRRLAGIERADSVTVDFHKSFFQPVSSSALVVPDPHDLLPVCWHAEYLNPEGSGHLNQVDRSLQTTRRFDALKLWVTLRAMGPDRIGELFDAVVDLAAEAAELIDADDRFDLVARPQLSTVLFRLRGAADEDVDRVRNRLLREGSTIIARTVVAGRPCFKITLLNPQATLDHVAEMLDAVAGAAHRLPGAARPATVAP